MKTTDIKVNKWYDVTTANGDVITGFVKAINETKSTVQFVFRGPNRPWIDADLITSESESETFSALPAWVADGQRVSPWGVISSVERFTVYFNGKHEKGDGVGMWKVLNDGRPVFAEDVEIIDEADDVPAADVVAVPEKKTAAPAKKVANNADAAADVVAALQKMMSGATGPAKIDEEQLGAINATIAALSARVKQLETAAPVKVEHIVKIDDTTTKVEGKTHALFDDVLAAVANGEFAYIFGPAGTGKSYLAKQVADALGVEYFEMNRVNESFDLEGYKDANGNFNDTPFYNAFKNGGLLLFDEFDTYAADALTFINNALANGRANFKGELVEKSPNFHLIAAGNTIGRGATEEYNTRTQIDVATMTRFAAKFEINYDPALELQFAQNDSALISFIYDLRRIAKENGLTSGDLGGRAIKAIKKWCRVYGDITKAVKYGLRNGQDDDTARIFANNLKVTNEYTEAYKSLCA